MTQWWFCGNEDCAQFERVASADKQPNCPTCRKAMTFIDKNELNTTHTQKTEVPDRPDRRPDRVYSEYHDKPDLEDPNAPR